MVITKCVNSCVQEWTLTLRQLKRLLNHNLTKPTVATFYPAQSNHVVAFSPQLLVWVDTSTSSSYQIVRPSVVIATTKHNNPVQLLITNMYSPQYTSNPCTTSCPHCVSIVMSCLCSEDSKTSHMINLNNCGYNFFCRS